MRTVHARRPRAIFAPRRPRVSAGLLASGVTAVIMIGVGSGDLPAPATLALAASAVIGIGAGLGLALRIMSDPPAPLETETAALLGSVFDDDYSLLVGTRLPGVPREMLGLLVGPGGVRAIAARGWRGQYRVRGRHWQYDAGRRHGWITCRTNPGFQASLMRAAVARWAAEEGITQNLPIEAAIVFPRSHSRVILEEPEAEVVTADNAPWWAHSIGRIQRLDTVGTARFVEAVIAASARPSAGASTGARNPGPAA